jgi:ParB-like chromosome segregation protein Spo0J
MARENSGILQLKIDPEIQYLCESLDQEASHLLEKDIDKNGCIDPIIYWKDQDTIVDGHNRFEICTRLGKTYNCIPMSFETKEDVMNYVIDHQLGRRNLSDFEKSYLRGRRYLTEKKAAHRPNSPKLHQNDGVKGETAQKIAEKNGVSQATIERDGVLAEAIDKLRAEVGDDFSKNLRAGKVKLSKKGTVELSKKPPEDLKALVELIEKGERLSQAEKIVRTQKASSSDSTTDRAPLPEKDESLEKVEQQLDRILKILTKKDATIQQDKLIKLSAKAQEICDRLKVIGAKNPNFSCQNTGCTSDDHQTEIREEPNDANSGNVASEEDDVAELDNDGLESIEDDSPNSIDASAELPEGWEGYQNAIERQNGE